MAFGLYFTPTNFSPERYDSIVAQLEAAGENAPAGRTHHFALETDGAITVFDVWESMEQFDAFGAVLLPILSAAGVDPGQPMVSRIHNSIEG
jgi:hypothetical protein